MSERNDGGPAFPTFEEIDHWDRDSEKYRESIAPIGGMSLRDYFAAKAMQADLEYQGLEGREDLPHVAAMAYWMADAMLKAREAK